MSRALDVSSSDGDVTLHGGILTQTAEFRASVGTTDTGSVSLPYYPFGDRALREAGEETFLMGADDDDVDVMRIGGRQNRVSGHTDV